MKKIFLYQLLFIAVIPCSVKSQTNEVTFPEVYYDFSLMPRTQLSSMSIKLFDDYYTHRPGGEAPGSNNYGTLLSIYGRVNHWETNLYFGADKKFYYRTSTWSGGTAEDGTVGEFHEWRQVLDSKSAVESNGILQISGDGDHYISQGRLVIGLNHFSLGTSPDPNLKVQINGGVTICSGQKLSFDQSYYVHGYIQYDNSATDGRFKYFGYYGHRWETSGGEMMRITRSGNVGIGTTNPGAKLDVNGNIRAERIDVISDVPASDYVFAEGYNLRSLKDVEQFVKTNKHLPEVPSAKEFKENGYSVGEMDDILLRKVEELTLYVIEQEKQNKSLEELVAQQRQLFLEQQKLIGQLKNKVEQLEKGE